MVVVELDARSFSRAAWIFAAVFVGRADEEELAVVTDGALFLHDGLGAEVEFLDGREDALFRHALVLGADGERVPALQLHTAGIDDGHGDDGKHDESERADDPGPGLAEEVELLLGDEVEEGELGEELRVHEPRETHAGDDEGGEEGGRRFADDEGDGEALHGAVGDVVEDDGGEERGEVRIEDGGEGALVSGLDRVPEGFAAAISSRSRS